MHYGELMKCLVRRDIVLRYKGSMMGFLWALINPLFMMLIFSFVFSKILRMDIKNYPLFLFSAFIPWNFFQTSLFAATPSISQNASIITKIFFPREIIPLSLVISNFIHTFLVGFVVNFALIIFYHVPLNLWLLFLPLVFIVQVLFTSGMALMLACLQVYFKDVTVLLGHVLTLWLYSTPIIYPLHMVPEPYLTWIRYNPLTGIIVAYRNILFYGISPLMGDFIYSTLISIAALIAGYWVFNRYQDYFAEEI
jgi:lipopolysaccharide transport system permease protein